MEQNRKARVGIIGAGGIANNVHLPSLYELEEADVVAICDLRLEKAQKAAEKYGIPNVYWDMYEMLEKEQLDGVFVLVEPDRLFRAAYDCLMAGVPVFMEKPAGVSAHQAYALARISKEQGVLCAVGMNRRHIPLVREVVRKMQEVTQIVQVDGMFVKNTDLSHEWLYSNAFLTDGVHIVDLVRCVAGSEAAAAATVTGRYSGSPVDNAWSSVIRFENGITGTVRSNYQTGGRVQRLEIHGPGASAFINLGLGGDECEADILYHNGGSIYSITAAGVNGASREHIDGKALAGSDSMHICLGYKAEDADFIRAILTKTPSLCTIEDAVGTMELVEMLQANSI